MQEGGQRVSVWPAPHAAGPCWQQGGEWGEGRGVLNPGTVGTVGRAS